jgi:hypothetical protein
MIWSSSECCTTPIHCRKICPARYPIQSFFGHWHVCSVDRARRVQGDESRYCKYYVLHAHHRAIKARARYTMRDPHSSRFPCNGLYIGCTTRAEKQLSWHRVGRARRKPDPTRDLSQTVRHAPASRHTTSPKCQHSKQPTSGHSG